jgi:hypothetical protein
MTSNWNSYLSEILHQIRTPDVAADTHARLVTDAYIVPSPDKQDLHFALPVVIKTGIFDEISLPLSGSVGRVQAVIEFCKQIAQSTWACTLVWFHNAIPERLEGEDDESGSNHRG